MYVISPPRKKRFPKMYQTKWVKQKRPPPLFTDRGCDAFFVFGDIVHERLISVFIYCNDVSSIYTLRALFVAAIQYLDV